MVFIGSSLMPISLRDILYVVFRHKWKVVAFFVVVVVGVTGLTYALPEKYRSEAKLLIRVGRESLSVDPSVSGPTRPVQQDRESEVNSELEILRSRVLVEQVVDALKMDSAAEAAAKPGLVGMLKGFMKQGIEMGMNLLVAMDLATPLAPHEKAVKQFMRGMSVEVESRTSIISVALESKGPQMARDALQKLIEYYLERHIEVHAAQAKPEFFELQEQRIRSELAQKEQALNDFKTQNAIATIDGQKDAMLEHINMLEQQLADAIVQENASKARVAALEETLKNRSSTIELSRTTGRTNYAADSLKQKLMDLKLEEADLSSRYPDDYRPLVEKRQQIKDAEAALSKEKETMTEVTTGLDSNFQELQLNLQNERAQAGAETARRQVVEGQLTQAKTDLANLAGKEVELTRLTREVQLLEGDYRNYRDNLHRARVSAALDIDKVSNVSVVQPATLPLDPVKPRKALNITLGIMLGLFGGVFLAFVFEYLDDSLNNKEDVEKWLGVPVLAVVSEEEYRACI